MKNKVIIAALGISMMAAFTGCSGGTVATVNDTEISAEDMKITEDIVSIINEYKTGKSTDDMSDEELSEFTGGVLTFMIDNELIVQEAEKEGIKVSDDEVENKAKELEATIKSNPILEKSFSENEITSEQLNVFVKKDMISKKYKDKFMESQKVKSEDLTKYYKDHQKDLEIEYAEASHILLATVNRDGTEISDNEKAKKKELAEEIVQKAKNGDDFAALAKKYSDDKETGEKGGDLGKFKREDKDAVFSRAVFALEEGNVSEVIETNSGYEVIKLKKKTKETPKYADIRESLKTKVLEEKYIKHLEELESKAEIDK